MIKFDDHSKIERSRNESYALFQSGYLNEARGIALKILDQLPEHSDSLYLLGVIAHSENNNAKALEWISKAVGSAPNNPVFWNALGEIQLETANQNDADASFQKSIFCDPLYARAFNNLGRLKMLQGDYEAARLLFEKAVNFSPKYAIAFNNLGVVLQKLELQEEAKVAFENALNNKPDYPEAHFNIANTLFMQGDTSSSIDHYQKAIKYKPDYAKAYFQLGVSFQELRRDYDALICFENAVKLCPNDSGMLAKLGDHLLVKQDLEKAIKYLEKAVEFSSVEEEAFARLCYARQLAGDWNDYKRSLDLLLKGVEIKIAKNECPSIGPFQSLTLPLSLDQLQVIARAHSKKNHQNNIGYQPVVDDNFSSKSRLRIGYLSSDFYDHPVGHLLQGFFGRHDRDNFEVFVYSFGVDDQSYFRKRIESESEHFVNVAGLSAKNIARLIALDNIHILVDLMGYTGFNRLQTFGMRPSPVQVSFLCMLGTMGADFIDYLVTDSFLTPEHYQLFFDEKFITMPHSYLVAELEPEYSFGKCDKEGHGLPPNGFVFCSFNNSYKIEPVGFSIWMRILKQVPGSVLWFAGQSGGSLFEKNLRIEAERSGVDHKRLVFGGFLPRNEHFKRHQIADLFLDSIIYNAAATSTLALQLGLPVLTCPGDTLSSRVGGSLLNSAGLPELIAKDLEDYERIAVMLANDPKLLNSYRERLLANRSKSPLFDTMRFVRNLEKAFLFMWENYKTGNKPKPFKVQE